MINIHKIYLTLFCFILSGYSAKFCVNDYNYNRDFSGALIIFQGFKLEFKNIKSGITEVSKFSYLNRFIDYVQLVLKSVDLHTCEANL